MLLFEERCVIKLGNNALIIKRSGLLDYTKVRFLSLF